MKSFFSMVVAPIIASCLLAALPIGGLVWLQQVQAEHQCKNYETITGKATRRFSFDACYVQTPEGWQRWDEYKARATASEGLKTAK